MTPMTLARNKNLPDGSRRAASHEPGVGRNGPSSLKLEFIPEFKAFDLIGG